MLFINEKTIVVVRDLTAPDTAQINKEMVAGIVTKIGGSTGEISINPAEDEITYYKKSVEKTRYMW